MPKLLVIIPDRLSVIVKKGEFSVRYYNPGNLFDEVHILMANDDKPDPAALQETVGDAQLTIHNIGEPNFKKTLGYRPFMLDVWAEEGVALAKAIMPNVVRCYGHGCSNYLAYAIKKRLGIPYIVSLHGNPDVDYLRGRLGNTLKLKMIGYTSLASELIGIRNADHVIAVYTPIVSYLTNCGVSNYSVIHNVVGHGIKQKTSYAITRGIFRLICIGRQENNQKNPIPIIEAVRDIPDTSLLLIGNGDLHDKLVKYVLRNGLEERITFVKNMKNSEIMNIISEHDAFVYSSINYEISKATIEASLAGIPVIINDRKGEPASELVGGHFCLVSGTMESYKTAIEQLKGSERIRSHYGELARQYAWKHWAPDKMEAKYVEIYKKILRQDATNA